MLEISNLSLNEMATRAHATAVEKGWYENDGPSPLEKHALIHSEVSEATEEVRNQKPPLYIEGVFGVDKSPDKNGPITMIGLFELSATEVALMFMKGGKPEGEAAELADVVIRIGDLFAHKGWDLGAVVSAKMIYNGTRSKRHGGKAL